MDLVALAAFVGGLIVFFGLHFYSAFRTRDADDRLEARMGAGPYKSLYSLISIVGFVAMIWGFDQIRWDPNNPWPRIPLATPDWTRHIAMLFMLPALILIIAAYVPTGYIKKAVKHPMLIAIMLWATAHLIANWDVGGLVMFGAFLVYAVIDRVAVQKRGDVGPAKANPNIFGDLIALAVGTAAFGIIYYYLHPLLFGVAIAR